jgi:hypothetical protein
MEKDLEPEKVETLVFLWGQARVENSAKKREERLAARLGSARVEKSVLQ